MLVKQEWMCLRTFWSSSCWFSEICGEHTRDRRRYYRYTFVRFRRRVTTPAHLQPLLQELDASLLSVGELVGKAPVPNQENHGLGEKKLQCNSTS